MLKCVGHDCHGWAGDWCRSQPLTPFQTCSLAPRAPQLSFALVVGDPLSSEHSAFLCCLCAAVLAVLVVNRMGANPPFLWVIGMVSCLAFGLTAITGECARRRQLDAERMRAFGLGLPAAA